MIAPTAFLSALKANGVSFFTGVPDSLLKSLCASIEADFPDEHLTATNEGSAIGMAIGSYLGSGYPALVYMQNSGLGNTINPLTSLADPAVYGVPMILLIGWRGEVKNGVQINDEPQHVKQGEITPDLLSVLGIPFEILDKDVNNIDEVVAKVVTIAKERRGPSAFIVRKGAFADGSALPSAPELSDMSREEAVSTVACSLPPAVRIISTTGMTSRELFEHRANNSGVHYRDFLTVGGMGHASQIAAGLAISRSDLQIVCLDGDGAMLMHAGGLAVCARQDNLIHILLNNQRHDSVGGQPTLAAELDMTSVAKSFGFKNVKSVSRIEEIAPTLASFLEASGACFLEIKCRSGARKDLGRPTTSTRQNIDEFIAHLDTDLT